MSIKAGERKRRRNQERTEHTRPFNSSQKLPTPFRKYLSSGQNKELLISFLVTHWKKEIPCGSFFNRTLFVTSGNKCFELRPENDTVIASEVEELTCDHEEADTRMLLHANHASTESDCILIKSNDTDVILLCLSQQQKIAARLFVLTGTSASGYKVWNITSMSEQIGNQMCTALLSFHAFTGCDSVSGFKGKGKVGPFLLLEKNLDFQTVFQFFGEEWEVDGVVLKGLERFLCQVFNQATQNINEARVKIFNATCRVDYHLPPNKDCFDLHVKRANYQAAIWRKCLQRDISAPSALLHGWEDKSGELCVQWSTLPYPPPELSNLVKCGCKGGCKSNRCACVKNNLGCTACCTCHDCQNPNVGRDLPEIHIDGEDSDTDSEAEAEEDDT